MTTRIPAIRSWWYKKTHWEFWSFNAVYLPVLPYLIWLGVKARSFFFFNASNPTIFGGGMLMESKWDIYQQMPDGSYPKTLLISTQLSAEELKSKAEQIGYPLIAKPDVGGKGRGVVVIHHFEEMLRYHQQIPIDYVLQQKIEYPLEIGVFYVRNPAMQKGTLTGIVSKDFLFITGNGEETVGQIVLTHKRYRIYAGEIENAVGKAWHEVLPTGERRQLLSIGNHARGATFYDVTQQYKHEITAFIKFIDEQIPWFHFGRVDLRFASWEALSIGKDFSIIEINGAGSEPTHMYDPGNSIFTAWGQMIKHWRWLYKISVANHQKGHPYMPTSVGIKMIKDNSAWEKKMDNFTFKPSP